jgi:hypothetical protein
MRRPRLDRDTVKEPTHGICKARTKTDRNVQRDNYGVHDASQGQPQVQAVAVDWKASATQLDRDEPTPAKWSAKCLLELPIYDRQPSCCKFVAKPNHEDLLALQVQEHTNQGFDAGSSFEASSTAGHGQILCLDHSLAMTTGCMP